jgi:hypothetical protein
VDNKKLDRMEGMLSNLITMVGNLNQKVQSVQEENAAIDEKLTVIEQEQSVMKCENQKQFTEIKSILIDMQADQEHIWEKAARNERELAKLRKHLQL